VVQELRDEKAKVEELTVYKEQKAKLDNLNLELYKTKSHKSGLENTYNNKIRSIQEANSTISNIEEKIAKYYEKEESIKNNEILNQELYQLSKQVNQVKLNLKSVNDRIADCSSNLQLMEKNRIKVEESIKTLAKLEDDYRYYGYYLTAVSKDGIPYSMMSSVIPVIEEDVNNILSQIVDFRINIKSDGKNINAYIVYEDDRIWPIELSSGMEKFISSLAIRTALINVCSLPRPNFLAIDEGFGSLDLDNMGNISILLDYLKTQFKFILMISHIDSIKDVVDSQISVAKGKNGLSKVQYL
jgi:DNA repair protein SbcC/Rad50